MFCALTNVFGQEREIAEQEFSALVSKAFQNLTGKMYRLTMINESFLGGGAEPRSVLTMTTEVAPPDRRRTISVFKSPSLNSKTETVWIGSKGYTRKEDGAWEDFKPNIKAITGGIYNTAKASFKFIEKTSINDQAVNVYESTRQYAPDANGAEMLEKMRYWITDTGVFLKRLSEIESTGKNLKMLSRTTTTYEYVQDIKIEAPIAAKKTKTQ